METRQSAPPTVLLVEDDPAHAQLVIRSFAAHPLPSRLHHVRDGEEALRYLTGGEPYRDRRRHPRPDLVLLDLRLPRIGGLELLRQIRARDELGPVPVVVLSTSHADSDVTQAYDHFANSYLVKPLEFDDFVQLVNDVGHYWLGWNQSHAGADVP